MYRPRLYIGVATLLYTAAASRGLEGNRWVNLTSLPSPRQEHATVAVDNSTIAILGGVERLGNDSVQTGLLTTNLVHLYDIPSDTWRPAAPLPLRINHPNAAAAHGRIYLLGGLIDRLDPPAPSADWIATGASYVYDPATDAWTALPPMPPGTERGSAVLGVHGDLIYVAGGMTVLTAAHQDAVTTVSAFNTTARAWQRVPPAAATLPSARQHAAGALVGPTLYVVGGRWHAQTAVRADVFTLDLRAVAAGWSTSPRRMPTARGGLHGGVVAGTFYAFGGECNADAANGIFPQAEACDLASGVWTPLPDMAVPRHGTAAVALEGRIYVPGGGLQQDGVPVERNGVVSYGHATAHFDAYEVRQG